MSRSETARNRGYYSEVNHSKAELRRRPRRTGNAAVWFLDDEWPRLLAAVKASGLSRRAFMKSAVMKAVEEHLAADASD